MPEAKGTADMPVPQTVNYSEMYDVKQEFINDVYTLVRDMAYADAKQILDYITSCGTRICVAQLNELIRMLSGIPYRYIAPVMQNIERNGEKYFVKVDEQKKQ